MFHCYVSSPAPARRTAIPRLAVQVTFPDRLAGEAPIQAGSLSMSAGDFLEVLALYHLIPLFRTDTNARAVTSSTAYRVLCHFIIVYGLINLNCENTTALHMSMLFSIGRVDETLYLGLTYARKTRDRFRSPIGLPEPPFQLKEEHACLQVYGSPSCAGQYDAVVTCFFIDTAHVITEYLKVIHHVLVVTRTS